MESIKISPELPRNDVVLLRNLADDIQRCQNPDPVGNEKPSSGRVAKRSSSAPGQEVGNGSRSTPSI